MEIVNVVRAVGTLACVLGLYLCYRVGRTRFSDLPADEQISVGNAQVSVAAFWKIAAFAALVILPAAAMAVANYHTFEGVHEVDSCGRCHVMRPMITDMRDAGSQTLAARHYRNGWIATDQCYSCHSDYGLSGNLAAKAEGYRHLARYTTRTYAEPIQYRGRFPNDNCLKCHEGKPPFKAVKSHRTVRPLLASSAMSCLNCHGRAHPTRVQRTPGSPDYARLMEAAK